MSTHGSNVRRHAQADDEEQQPWVRPQPSLPDDGYIWQKCVSHVNTRADCQTFLFLLSPMEAAQNSCPPAGTERSWSVAASMRGRITSAARRTVLPGRSWRGTLSTAPSPAASTGCELALWLRCVCRACACDASAVTTSKPRASINSSCRGRSSAFVAVGWMPASSGSPRTVAMRL